jgi:hypothetical protein
MSTTKKMFKVLTPVQNEKTGKTHWVKLGIGFTNNDSSINLHLDALPTNGKLQLRDWDEEDRREGPNSGTNRTASYAVPSEPASAAADALPF